MKKSIIPVAAFIAGMAIVPGAFAEIKDTDNYSPITTWDGLIACLKDEDRTECSAAEIKDADFYAASANITDVKGTKVLDLANKTLDVKAELNGSVIVLPAEANLTIKNGTIDSKVNGKYATINSQGNNTLKFENVTFKAAKPLVVSGADKKNTTVIVDAASSIEATGAEAALSVSDKTEGKTTIVVDGDLKSKTGFAFSGEGAAYEATLRGTVTSAEGQYAIAAGAGTLILSGATVSAPFGAGVITTPAANGKVKVQDCTTIAAKNEAIYMNGNVNELTVNGSTLKSSNGSVFGGAASAAVENVVIKDSYLESKDNTTPIKANGIAFTNFNYDGATNNGGTHLSEIKGSYGTLAAVCGGDAAADEENKGDDAENPNTADTIATYLTIATVALLGLGATAFVAKKSNR